MLLPRPRRALPARAGAPDLFSDDLRHQPVVPPGLPVAAQLLRSAMAMATATLATHQRTAAAVL